MKAPSVALFTYSTLPRGSVVHASYLAEALHDCGVDVTLYALDKDQRGFFRPLRAPLELVPVGTAPATTPELVRQRADELSSYLLCHPPRHDVLHAQDCLTASGLLQLRSRGARFSLIRTVHHLERFACPFLASCQVRSIREADLNITVSATVERELRAELGVAPWRTGNGVRAARFEHPDERRVAAWGERLPPGAGPVVLSVGGIEERKNSRRLLGAFARLAERRPGARWWILGGATVLDHGAYRSEFERELRALPAAWSASVSELGVVDDEDVPALLHLADVVAVPSLQEGFGLVALEALAAGTPLVVSRRPPFTEYLDERAATLVDPDSEADLARGLLQALESPAIQRERGRAIARAHDWKRVALAHLVAYRRILGGAHAADRPFPPTPPP